MRNRQPGVRGHGHRRMLLALIAVLALVAAACNGNDDDAVIDDDVTDDVPTDVGELALPASVPEGDESSLHIGWIPWDEDVAVTFLWAHVLGEIGYDVELTQLDVAPVYAGMAAGNIDVFLDGWLPVTHEDFWEEFGPQLEDIGIWYDQGLLTIAVPDYVDAQSLADLADMGGVFDDRIIGIEPGAGLTRITREQMMPTYGLDDWELVEGSTPAMLAELERAIDREDDIVVTLWRPHWAYGAFPIRDLEDPEGVMGEAENLHVLARSGFSEDYPTLSQWFANFEMTDEAIATLTELVINQFGEGQEFEAVQAWLADADNRALVESWLT